MKRNKEEVRQQWIEAILAQRTSGLNIREYCEQQKISRPSFFQKRKELGLKKRCVKQGLPRGFMQIKPPAPFKIPPSDEIRTLIETPNGYKVHVRIMKAEELMGLLTAIKSL